MSKELIEVTRLLNLFIDGEREGNSDKVNEAYHPSARWFGTYAGNELDWDKTAFTAHLVGKPGDSDNFGSKITDIQIDCTAASATIRIEGWWGTLSFTDYLQLWLLGGRWQITSKTFAHTGGKQN